MATALEGITAAIAAACGTVTGATVTRGAVLPETIPAAGLLRVAEGVPDETGELLGGAREWVVEIEVEMAVQEARDAERAAAFDALATTAAMAVLASADLAAASDHVRIGALRDRQDLAFEGAAAVRTATLPVEVHYRTGPNPMEEI